MNGEEEKWQNNSSLMCFSNKKANTNLRILKIVGVQEEKHRDACRKKHSQQKEWTTSPEIVGPAHLPNPETTESKTKTLL